MRQYLTGALTCTSLVLSDVEHRFLCLVAISVSSEQCLSRVLRRHGARFLVVVVVVVVEGLYAVWEVILHQSDVCKYVLSFCGLPLYSVANAFCCTNF